MVGPITNSSPCILPTSDRGLDFSNHIPIVAQVPNVHQAQTGSRSWASGDTQPVTPNSLLQNFRNRMPIGAAVSTEVSGSIGIASQSPRSSPAVTPRSQPCIPAAAATSPSPTANVTNHVEAGSLEDHVTTRGMSNFGEQAQVPRAPRLKTNLVLLPRVTSDAIAANKLCFILHPECGDTVIAEGKTGGSWKSPSQIFGNLCKEEEQMVQMHKIIRPNLPLLFLEDRQPFTLLDHALVKSSRSSVYVK